MEEHSNDIVISAGGAFSSKFESYKGTWETGTWL